MKRTEDIEINLQHNGRRTGRLRLFAVLAQKLYYSTSTFFKPVRGLNK